MTGGRVGSKSLSSQIANKANDHALAGKEKQLCASYWWCGSNDMYGFRHAYALITLTWYDIVVMTR